MSDSKPIQLTLYILIDAYQIIILSITNTVRDVMQAALIYRKCMHFPQEISRLLPHVPMTLFIIHCIILCVIIVQ